VAINLERPPQKLLAAALETACDRLTGELAA
jgi:hypothetical protein